MKRLETDVLVVGGGTAGVTAALAAAESKARVLLAESSGGIGGVGTHSGIHAYYLGVHAGIQLELDRRTREIAEGLGGKAKGFPPEAKKIALQQLLAERGVELLCESVAVETLLTDGRIAGVVFETPEETVTVSAAFVLDSTGNGDICALAGVPFEQGREWDGIMNPYSVAPRFLNDTGIASFSNFDAGWVDSSSTKDVSRALIDGRKLLLATAELGQDGFIAITPHIGVREGRLIRGEYTLTLEDFIIDRRFDDVVMKCFSHYDTHAKDMANENRFAELWTEVMGAWGLRLGGDVPYRSFIPVGIDGLIIACRALSMEHDAAAALRMQPDMHAVGEVAGTAAAMCLAAGCEPRALDVAALQQRLVERGVLQGADLTRASAPWVTPAGSKRDERLWTDETVRQPAALQQLADALGTDEEGKALWWLWRAGDAALPVMRALLASASGRQKRGAAIALALLGDRSGVPELIRAVAEEDGDGLPGYEPRVPSRWIACLVALKHLQVASCAEMVIGKLSERVAAVRLTSFARTLHIAHYLIEVEALLSRDVRQQAASAVERLLADPDLGSDWGTGVQSSISIRWNLELNLAYLAGLLDRGDIAERLFARYEQDERGYVRLMAQKLRDRLSEAAKRSANGMVKQA
ncbi:MAG: hypothetical protein K0Q59_209 [Paenibacillus sp.]|nr:hypothetical protein [Paenibacillus sp.]